MYYTNACIVIGNEWVITLIIYKNHVDVQIMVHWRVYLQANNGTNSQEIKQEAKKF